MIVFLHTHTMSRTREKLRRCLNGYNGEVSLKGIPVYHDWSKGESYDILGEPLNKDNWIEKNIENPEHYDAVSMMLVDWVLYENGWFIDSYNKSQLYRYVCQLSYVRPDALEYIKK